MNRRRQRIAELQAARAHIDQQIRLLLGDIAQQPAVDMTPAQIREHAEQIRARAVRRYRDTDQTILTRRHNLLTDRTQWVDYRHPRKAAA